MPSIAWDTTNDPSCYSHDVLFAFEREHKALFADL